MPPARWVYVVGAAVTCLTMWATEFADSADSADSGTEEAGQRRLDLGDYDGSRQKFYDLDHLFLIIASVLVLSLGSLAAGAGVGGGGLFVPIFWLVLKVGAKSAVPLSKATILGGSIGNFVSLAWQKHPSKVRVRPMIDYEAACFMQSGELLGVVFGVLLNVALPQIFIIGFLVAILSFNARRTYVKAVSSRKKEDKAMATAVLAKVVEELVDAEEGKEELARDKEIALTEMGSAQNSQSDLLAHAKELGRADDGVYTDSATGEQLAELAAVLEDEATQFPLWAWGQLVPMTAFTCAYGIIKSNFFTPCATWEGGYRGGHGSGQSWAGGLFWVWYFTPVPVLACFMIYTGRFLKKRQARKDALGKLYVPLPHDLHWDDTTLAQFPKVALLAGLAAGLLGIGGGMVIGPLFMHLDLQPQVGTSTCAFMIMWTATSGVILYIFAGKLNPQLALYCICIGFCSGQLGQFGVNRVIKKTGRPSYVIYLLFGIIAAACVAMTVAGLYTLSIEGQKSGLAKLFEPYFGDLKCIH